MMMILIAEARARGHAGVLGLPHCDCDGEVFRAEKAKAAADEVEFAINASDAEAGPNGKMSKKRHFEAKWSSFGHGLDSFTMEQRGWMKLKSRRARKGYKSGG
ncbi:mitogen-activated protein kinase kinase kinase 1-like [Pyrus ussuriensis x Pyrus communis]|uniref:Mitogen-activated protein kinase kinase kinase 1-like n=1 Tax=Pyrus ussuriensis x Pyrus communis TaxID=2448454 RepID=A0A5N5HJ02_9ROSA|nr:mitogen-activated protein kinase kinase kinase 1-like [Pyrus ussuriensis x Pyrus communis]